MTGRVWPDAPAGVMVVDDEPQGSVDRLSVVAASGRLVIALMPATGERIMLLERVLEALTPAERHMLVHTVEDGVWTSWHGAWDGRRCRTGRPASS